LTLTDHKVVLCVLCVLCVPVVSTVDFIVPDDAPETSRTIDDWSAAIAAPTASPGGGAAAALTAALAASLVEMVAGLTIEREQYAAIHDEAERTRARAAALRLELVQLASEDAESFHDFVRALALPRTTELERSQRAEAKRAALQQASQVQYQLLLRLVGLSDLGLSIAQSGHAGSMGDAATAVFLAAGAARSAYWAIRSNLSGNEIAAQGGALPESALAKLEQVEANEWRVRQLLSERVP
jgi:methenyltetrahydrofolate cyclohydrolase